MILIVKIRDDIAVIETISIDGISKTKVHLKSKTSLPNNHMNIKGIRAKFRSFSELCRLFYLLCYPSLRLGGMHVFYWRTHLLVRKV